MGQYQSQSISQVAKSLTENINSETSNLVQNVGTTAVVIQNLTVECRAHCPKINPCSLSNSTIVNDATQIVTLSADQASTVSANLTTSISNALSSTAAQNEKTIGTWLDLSPTAQKQSITQASDLVNRIQNIVSVSGVQNCVLSAMVIQNNKVVFCGSAENLDIENYAVQDAIATCNVSATLSLITQDAVINQILLEASQAQSSTILGIGATVLAFALAALIIWWLLRGTGNKKAATTTTTTTSTNPNSGTSAGGSASASATPSNTSASASKA